MATWLDRFWLEGARNVGARLKRARTCVVCGRVGHGLLGDDCGVDVVRRAKELGVLTLGSYDSPLGESIRRLKFQDDTHLAGRLGRALAERHRGALCSTVLVPVPLHPLRLAERGYNQSALVARSLGRALGLRVDTSSLVRSAATEHQVGKDARARSENLRDCFRVTRHASTLLVKRVALLDDVHTTGATLGECEQTLARAGIHVAIRIAVAVAD